MKRIVQATLAVAAGGGLLAAGGIAGAATPAAPDAKVITVAPGESQVGGAENGHQIVPFFHSRTSRYPR